MKDHVDQFPVKKMAEVLKVSRSGYYSYLKRSKSPRETQVPQKLDLTVFRGENNQNGEVY